MWRVSNVVWPVVLLVLGLTLSIRGDKFDPDYLEKDIYYWVSGESKCVRLSTKHNRTGCATWPGGSEAQLRYIENATDLAVLMDNHPKRSFAVVTSLQLISDSLINDITQLTHCKGIIFLQDDDSLTPPTNRIGYSPDSTSPMYYLRPDRHGDHTYLWNPHGSFLMFQQWPFAIITVTKSQSSSIQNRAMANEESMNNGEFGKHFVEFTYGMFAKNDSNACLDDNDCLPVGGYSVWASFEAMNRSNDDVSDVDTTEDKPFIFGVTSMDTTAMFHQNIARGGDATQSGLIAFLAAINVLSGIKEELQSLPKQIIFAAFQGESYDLVGSRKFVHDINGGFQCIDPMTNFADGCWEPYATSMDFLNLNLSRIDALIELQQIGIPNNGNRRKLWAHYERQSFGDATPMNDNITSILDDLSIIASQISNQTYQSFDVSVADDTSLPGTPPGSYWSFLNGNEQLSGVVLTDHATSYSNQWYHSVYDSFYNGLDVQQLCMSATLFARILYKLAATDAFYDPSLAEEFINADCNLVQTLLECLLEDMTCDLVATMSSQAAAATPSHYTSVYQIIEDPSISGTAKFVFRYLANATRRSDPDSSCSSNTHCFPDKVCGGTDSGTYCVESSTYFHAAVEPMLEFDYGRSRWSIPNDSDVAALFWTESTWSSDIGTRFYEKESNETAIAMLLGGIAMLLVSTLFVWRLHLYCDRKFKVLSY